MKPQRHANESSAIPSPAVLNLASSCGISRLANLTGLDRVGYPVVAAIRPLSRNLTVSLGKGSTLESAQISAVMEAVELSLSERCPVKPMTARYRDFAESQAVDPGCLDVVHGLKDCRNVSLEWVPGRNLLTDEDVWVPWQAISMDFTSGIGKPAKVLRSSGTGLAASWKKHDACLHALYEVVERDSHAAWNELEDEARLLTLVDPTGLSSDSLMQTLLLIRNADLDIWVWDMTSDCGVPCYLVELLDFAVDAPTAYAQGAAAHLVQEMALEKALAEALQVRLTYISGSRDDLAWSDYGNRYHAVVHSRRWLSELQPSRRLLNTDQRKSAGDAASDVADLCSRIQSRRQADIVEVSLSAAEDAVCAVKVIVPQLLDTPESDHFEELRRKSHAN